MITKETIKKLLRSGEICTFTKLDGEEPRQATLNYIEELEDKLRRRNMQIKELKKETALIKAKIKTDDQLFPRNVI